MPLNSQFCFCGRHQQGPRFGARTFVRSMMYEHRANGKASLSLRSAPLPQKLKAKKVLLPISILRKNSSQTPRKQRMPKAGSSSLSCESHSPQTPRKQRMLKASSPSLSAEKYFEQMPQKKRSAKIRLLISHLYLAPVKKAKSPSDV